MPIEVPPAPREHKITITDLPGHPVFALTVKCTCGTTLYAVSVGQAEGHKQFHLAQIKRQEALNASK